jgi:hypothetical protein
MENTDKQGKKLRTFAILIQLVAIEILLSGQTAGYRQTRFP